jgi:hypothetical protein
MILTVVFLALLRLAWVMQQQIIDFVKKWSNDVRGIEDDSGENEILLYTDINFNDPDPLHLRPNNELFVYDRRQTANRMPGAMRDYWYVRSMRFKGNVQYQLKVYNDKDVDIIILSDMNQTEVPNIIDWLKTLPSHIQKKIDNPERRAISFNVVSKQGVNNGTGISTVPAILIVGRDYKTDYLSNEYKVHLEKNEPELFCTIESTFERLPTGVLLATDGIKVGSKTTQKIDWNFKSLKVNPKTRIKLIVKEEGLYNEYDDAEVEYVFENNIPDLETWLELQDQMKVKYNPKFTNKNERRYYFELV